MPGLATAATSKPTGTTRWRCPTADSSLGRSTTATGGRSGNSWSRRDTRCGYHLSSGKEAKVGAARHCSEQPAIAALPRIGAVEVHREARFASC